MSLSPSQGLPVDADDDELEAELRDRHGEVGANDLRARVRGADRPGRPVPDLPGVLAGGEADFPTAVLGADLERGACRFLDVHLGPVSFEKERRRW